MLIEHGDEVIVPVPFWVSYKDIIEFAGGTPVFLETNEAENFRVTVGMIEAAITNKTKAIILNTPSNPSGAVLPAEDLYAIVRLAHSKGIYVLLDECYVYLTFAGEIVSGRIVHRVQGARDCPRVALQDLCDDRVARGFRSRPEADHLRDEQAAVAEHLEHGEHGAARFDCRADRIAGVRSRDACRLHQAARPCARRFQVYSGSDLHRAGGRLLRVSQCERIHRQGRH